MRQFADAMNDIWFRRRSAELCLALALSPIFAWIEPFGVDEESFFARLGFWSGMLACWFILVALTDLLMSRTSLDELPPLARRLMLVALAVLPMIPITGTAINALTGWEPSVAEVTELYAQIFVIGSLMNMLGDQVASALHRWAAPASSAPALRQAPYAAAPESTEAAPPAAPRAPASALIARLPADIRGPILCLEMQDHYVRVHTARGAALVLMRLRDAIEQTGPIAGRQVHRSWWVADDAVRGFERAGRVGAIELTDGRRVPVSQRYLTEVEDACRAITATRAS